MFEKLSQAAERAATSVSRRAVADGVSRRGFLGETGRLGVALGGVLGGLSAFPAESVARPLKKCCVFADFGFYATECIAHHKECPPGFAEFYLVSNCNDCG
jgi:hypothetical protein